MHHLNVCNTWWNPSIHFSCHHHVAFFIITLKIIPNPFSFVHYRRLKSEVLGDVIGDRPGTVLPWRPNRRNPLLCGVRHRTVIQKMAHRSELSLKCSIQPVISKDKDAEHLIHHTSENQKGVFELFKVRRYEGVIVIFSFTLAKSTRLHWQAVILPHIMVCLCYWVTLVNPN